MITIQELLYNRGLDENAKVKLVRHQVRDFDLYNIYLTSKSEFLEYQSQQSKDIFNGVAYIVSFIGEEGTLARFIGVFKINSGKKIKGQSIDGGHYEYLYDMTEEDGFEALKERVIIDWGKGPIKWEQDIKNKKEVVQIQLGLHYKIFKDFDFILSFQELKEIITQKYGDWKRMLSATNAIYLISDTKTGKQYVGSTYGAEGVWGRWEVYAKNGHGNNKALKKLLETDEDYAQNYSFSILMLLPKTITPDQAIQKETLYKKKLGTNSFGLNHN